MFFILSCIILISTLVNVSVLGLFHEFFFASTLTYTFLYISLLLVPQAIIFVGLLKKFYDTPIKKLKTTIQDFYHGKLRNTDLDFPVTLNSDLNSITVFIRKTLVTLKNIKNEFQHGKEIKTEVQLASEIQGKLLNKKLLQIPSLKIVAASKPAGEIGGDSFDVIQQDDNYYIYVGDATGHGVGAGFIMAMVNALISGFAKTFASGSQILAYTNLILKPRVKSSTLMTLLLIRWNEKEKKMYMTGAGHEYLLIYKHKQNKCYKVKSGGVALGMVKNIEALVHEKRISFEENDIIVLYSDGITEAINQPMKSEISQMFGEERLVQSIQNAPFVKGEKYKSAQAVFNNITMDLSKFMGYNYTQFDDITLSVIHYPSEDFNIAHDYDEEISKEFLAEWDWSY